MRLVRVLAARPHDHRRWSVDERRGRGLSACRSGGEATFALKSFWTAVLGRGERTLRLEPLYRIRFTYSEGWGVELEGGWEQLLFLAEGRCEGSVTGRFRGANFPQRRTSTGPFVPDFRAVIETDDG